MKSNVQGEIMVKGMFSLFYFTGILVKKVHYL